MARGVLAKGKRPKPTHDAKKKIQYKGPSRKGFSRTSFVKDKIMNTIQPVGRTKIVQAL